MDDPGTPAPTPQPGGSDTAALVGDRADSLEELWRLGQRPNLEELLVGLTGPRRAAVLRELVNLEMELRFRAGETPRAEDYLRRFPELAQDADAARSLVGTEDRLRRRRSGSTVTDATGRA